MVFFGKQHVLAVFLTSAVVLTEAQDLRIGLIPKYDTPFFEPSFWGCRDKSEQLSAKTGRNVTCIYAPPVSVRDDGEIDGNDQAEFIFNLMLDNEVDAMMVSVLDSTIVAPVIDKIVDAGIPVITFDSDAPSSKRAAYTGTDNYFMGRALGGLAKQSNPSGGTYSVHYVAEADNLIQRKDGVVDELEKYGNGLWTPISTSPFDTRGTNHIDSYFQVARSNEVPDVIISVTGFQMDHKDWKPFVDENRAKNITYIAGDQSPAQLSYVETGYAQGLVGQKPYDFGSMGAELCFKLANRETLDGDFFGTDMVIHTVKPFNLPELSVDQNLLGARKVVGALFFALVALCAFFGMYKAISSKDSFFVMAISAGVLIMAFTLIPLSLDDKGMPEELSGGEHLCMSVPWLSVIGFSIVQATLYSKIAEAKSEQEVGMVQNVLPIGGLVLLNLIVLTIWSIVDPLTFVRADSGRDPWDRVNDTIGQCRAENPEGFWITIVVINLCAVLFTSWSLIRLPSASFTGTMQSVGWACSVTLQLLLTGIPILFVVRDMPQKYYMVFSFALFLGCMGILASILVVPALAEKNDGEPVAAPTPAPRSKKSKSKSKKSSRSKESPAEQAPPPPVKSAPAQEEDLRDEAEC